MEDDNARERPLAVPRPETGEPRVDAALSLLDELTELPVTEHPAMFEQVHAQLSEVLGELGAPDAAAWRPPGRDRQLSGLAATVDMTTGGCGWTPSWSGGAWPGPATRPRS